MESGRASETAMCTALMRATHAKNDVYPILRDEWGDRLISRELAISLLRHVPDGDDLHEEADRFIALDRWLRANPAYAGVLVRARYTEEVLGQVMCEGVVQYVIVGAGFDSFAFRTPQYERRLKVFEVDHPATQALKINRLAECGVKVPANLSFVPADLSRVRLDEVLKGYDFDPGRATLFTWLGVTMYLDRCANLTALKGIRRSATVDSHLVFTYLDQVMFDKRDETSVGRQSFEYLKASVNEMSEPLVSGFYPAELPSVFEEIGLSMKEDIDNVEAVRRYDPEGLNGLNPVKYGHIVWASMR